MGAVHSTEPRARNSGAGGPRLIQSPDRTLTILDAFITSARPDLGVQDLAQIVGVSPSTASRLLATLESHGYVQQDGAGGRFRLGSRALQLGRRFAQTNELTTRAAYPIEQLARYLGLITNLYCLDQGYLIRYLTASSPPKAMLTRPFRFLPHTSAAGKVLLAYLPAERLDVIVTRFGLPAVTPRTITTIEQLRSDLALTRRRGYGFDDEECFLGVRCVAVPVRNANGEVVAAIDVFAKLSKMVDQCVPQTVEALLETAKHISEALGHQPHQDGRAGGI